MTEVVYEPRDPDRMPPRRQTVRWRLARLVTEVFAPAPTAAVLLLLVAWQSAPTAAEGLRWGLLASLFASLVPFLYVARGVRRRRLTDHHVRVREQRPVPLVVGIVSVLAGLVLLFVWGAPRDLVALVGAMAVGLMTATLVTLFWKLSIHAAVVAGAVVILVLVFGSVWLISAPIAVLVSWARVEVGDHTPAQAAAGVGLGAASAAVVFSLLR